MNLAETVTGCICSYRAIALVTECAATGVLIGWHSQKISNQWLKLCRNLIDVTKASWDVSGGFSPAKTFLPTAVANIPLLLSCFFRNSIIIVSCFA